MLPVRGSARVAGYDLCAANSCVIPSWCRGTIETGLAVSLPQGTYAQIAPRSGLAIQNFINIGTGVVDSDYQGKIKVVLFNHSIKDFAIQASDRIPQLILESIDTPQVKKVVALDDTDHRVGVLAPSRSLSPLSQKTKWVQRKIILYPQHQAQNSINMVINVGPGPSSTCWLARGSTNDREVDSPNSVPGGRLERSGNPWRE